MEGPILRVKSLFSMDYKWWAAFTVGIGVYMSTVDASVVNISLPTITNALHTDLGMIGWVVMVYLLTISGLLLPMGSLADLFGRKQIYLRGFAIFTLGSALCGISPTIHWLIASRAIQAIGAAALMANGAAILTETFPARERGQAMGIIGSVVSAGFLTGPILGGFLVDLFGWRSIFYINVPIGLLGIAMSSRILRERAVTEGKARFDIVGALAFLVFVVSLLLVINQGTERGWDSPYILSLWVIISLSLATFLLTEVKASSPMVDLTLFKERMFAGGIRASFLSFWMIGSHSFIMPFFLQRVIGYHPAEVGMLVAPLSGRLSDRIGVRLPATIGLLTASIAVMTYLRSWYWVTIWRHPLAPSAFGVWYGSFCLTQQQRHHGVGISRQAGYSFRFYRPFS